MSKMRKTRKALAGIGAILALLLILTLYRIYAVTSNGGATVLHPTSDGNVSLFTSFEGASGPGYKDHPDASGAVGPNHVVDFTGSVFIVHEKKTGIVLEKLTQAQFWKNAGITTGTINDPRIIYDPLSSRWFAVESAPYDTLAVSADSDPTHAWKAVTLSTGQSGDLLERIGIDANGIYVCSFGRSGKVEATCFAIPKKDVLWSGSGSVSLAHMTTFLGLPYETFPATDLNPAKSATAPEIFLTRQGSQNDLHTPLILLMEKVVWSGTTAHVSAPQSIKTDLSYTVPGTAHQPGSFSPGIKAKEDHRILDLITSRGAVFGAIGTEIGNRVGADWFDVRVSDGKVIQQATIANPTYDVLFPTVAADVHGNVAFSFTKTSTTENPSVYVAVRKATDPPNTLRAPVLVAAGTSPFACDNFLGSTWLGTVLKLGSADPIGWGTYSTTVQDPSNPQLLWTYQEYGHSANSCQWSTRWISFAVR